METVVSAVSNRHHKNHDSITGMLVRPINTRFYLLGELA